MQFGMLQYVSVGFYGKLKIHSLELVKGLIVEITDRKYIRVINEYLDVTFKSCGVEFKINLIPIQLEDTLYALISCI